MSQLPTPSPTPVREAEPKEDRLADVKVPVLKDEPTIANLKPKITALAREAAEAQGLSKKTKKATEYLEDKLQKSSSRQTWRTRSVPNFTQSTDAN